MDQPPPHAFAPLRAVGPENAPAARAGLPVPQAAYALTMPQGPLLPVVVSSPHSGRVYPVEAFAAVGIDTEGLRLLEDGAVDRLLAACPAAGAPLLAATYARAYVDLNRDPDELDPDLLASPVDRARLSPRVRAGLGVVPSRLAGRPIYRHRLRPDEIALRLATAYAPYHRRLEALMDEGCAQFDAVLLVDCHSMPSTALQAAAGGRADVILGDRFGRSCAPAIVAAAERLLAAEGLRVARNRPYAGGHITEHYGAPARGRHALQVELRRDLFMDEATHALHGGAPRLAEAMGRLVAMLGGHVAASRDDAAGLPLANVASA